MYVTRRIVLSSIHTACCTFLPTICNFVTGLFMGLQDRIVVCGTKLAVYGMILRFLVGPALFAAASYLVGLRGVPLHVSIVQVKIWYNITNSNLPSLYSTNSSHLMTPINIPRIIPIQQISHFCWGFEDTDIAVLSVLLQAALPQGIVPFVFAKEYNVHPEILSTA